MDKKFILLSNWQASLPYLANIFAELHAFASEKFLRIYNKLYTFANQPMCWVCPELSFVWNKVETVSRGVKAKLR